jgi:hypothetical protein
MQVEPVKRILLYALAYLLWLVNMAVCIAAIIQVRSTVNVLWVAMGGNRYSLGLVNQAILLVGGFAVFVYVVFLEGYYRESIARIAPARASGDASLPAQAARQGRLARWLAGAGLNVLLRRFVVTTAIPLGVLVLSLALLEVVLRVWPS